MGPGPKACSARTLSSVKASERDASEGGVLSYFSLSISLLRAASSSNVEEFGVAGVGSFHP